MSARTPDEAVNAWLAEKERQAYTRALYHPNGARDGLRIIGFQQLGQGLELVHQAFNTNNRPECPYTFDDAVRARAAELAMELFQLWKACSGSMRVHTAALAPHDNDFQHFLEQASSAPNVSSPSRARAKRRTR